MSRKSENFFAQPPPYGGKSTSLCDVCQNLGKNLGKSPPYTPPYGELYVWVMHIRDRSICQVYFAVGESTLKPPAARIRSGKTGRRFCNQ
jgi:hypothetical protein